MGDGGASPASACGVAAVAVAYRRTCRSAVLLADGICALDTTDPGTAGGNGERVPELAFCPSVRSRAEGRLSRSKAPRTT